MKTAQNFQSAGAPPEIRAARRYFVQLFQRLHKISCVQRNGNVLLQLPFAVPIDGSLFSAPEIIPAARLLTLFRIAVNGGRGSFAPDIKAQFIDLCNRCGNDDRTQSGTLVECFATDARKRSAVFKRNIFQQRTSHKGVLSDACKLTVRRKRDFFELFAIFKGAFADLCNACGDRDTRERCTHKRLHADRLVWQPFTTILNIQN